MITLSHDGAVSTVRMSRPPVNAIDPAFVAAFLATLDLLERAAPSLVVIRSDQKCFSAGADLGLINDFFTRPDGIAEMVAYVGTMHAWFDRLQRLPAVTLAAISGPALGGGLELALACDLRIATHAAQLGLPETRVGMIPGAGGTQRLPRLCGPGIAARLILSGEIVDGREALRIGLVQWAVEDAALDAEVASIAARIAGLSRPALAAAKHCLAAAHDPGVDGFARELAQPLTLMRTPEARQRIGQFLAPKAAQST